MKNENYILIQGWMINELKLSGNELLVYSIIYGFSQDGESSFQGSSNYIAECLNISQRSVFTILQKLVEKDLIKKIDNTINNVKFINYKINNEKINFTKNQQTSQGMKNFHRGYEEISEGDYEETSYNNTILYNTNNNIKKENKKEKKELDLSFCDSQFLELINKWLKYKKEKKQSYTQMGIEMFYKKLLTLSNNNLSVASEIINNSIANNYAGIFELKNNKSSNYNYCSQQDCPY